MRSAHPSEAVTVYGDGEPGGKGAGLIAVNGWDLPCNTRLPTMILATGFYDRYLDRGRRLCGEDFAVLGEVLEALGERPIGVRSSATDEAWAPGGGRAIHAGENLSFMLPNNHENGSVRLRQLALAVQHVYDDFCERHGPGSRARMGIVINPIPGLFDDTAAGPFFYPYVSGVADSFFPYALKNQDPRDGYGRIAFGHGYATVLDDFPVIPMATIRHPLPLDMLQTGRGQQFFYAVDLTKNSDLQGDELETMKKLHVRHASFHRVRLLGVQGQIVTIENLVQLDQFSFRTSLARVMDEIAARLASNFQIEFVFNLDFRRKPCRDGSFHVVQLTSMPSAVWNPIEMPARAARTYLSTSSLQGHGVRRGLRHAIVVSPFLYSKEQHDLVREQIAGFNKAFSRSGESYVLVVPGRLGSRNRDWGIYVEYGDVSQAAAIFEYGVDIAGRVRPLPEEGEMTGGTYGSHFLYVVLGGYSEDQRRLQARMHGTQGTHFFTNLMSGNVVYAYVSPAEDTLDPWLFSPPSPGGSAYVLTFPRPASIFADAIRQRCLVVEEDNA